MCRPWFYVGYMQVYDGSTYIAVAQQSLYGMDIYAVFHQMGGIAMSQRMHADLLFDGGPGQRFIYYILNAAFTHGLSRG